VFSSRVLIKRKFTFILLFRNQTCQQREYCCWFRRTPIFTVCYL